MNEAITIIDNILDYLANSHTFTVYAFGETVMTVDLGVVIITWIAFALVFGLLMVILYAIPYIMNKIAKGNH